VSPSESKKSVEVVVKKALIGDKGRHLATVLLVGLVMLATQMGAVRPSEAFASTSPSQGKALSSSGTPSVWSVDTRMVADCLVSAVIQVESGGNPRKVGSAGERGVMQIKRETWMGTTRRMYGKTVPFDRAFDESMNRRVGRAYLAELQSFLARNRNRWRSDERSLLLACYNAGPTRVMKAGFDVRRLPRSVRSYVERASALHDYYLEDSAPAVKALLATETGAGRGRSS